MNSQRISKAAENAVELAEPGKEETLLVLCDETTRSIGKALLRTGTKKCSSFLIVMPVGKRHGMEPPSLVAEAMKNADIIFAPLKYSITHTNASREASENARIATLPGITEEVLVRGLKADYKKIQERNAALAEQYEKTRQIRVKAENTDFIVKRGPRKICDCGGQIHEKGKILNLPDGECGFAPVDFNGYFTGTHGKKWEDKTFHVKDNKVMHVEDAELKKKLWSIENARNIAEFSIGTNPGAELSEVTLEAEKVLGTSHVAVGDSKGMGGDTDAPIHWDFVIKSPSIWFDDRQVMKKGELLL